MQRQKKGSHLIELCAAVMVLVPLMLYGIDMASIFFAGSINSSLCRDACRAAAAGPPTMFCTDLALAPTKRAERVVAARFDPKAIIRVSKNPVVTETIREPKPIAPWGGPVQGEVTVQTEVTVNPPFKLPAIASVVQMKTESSFPITWVMQPAYKGNVQPADKGEISGSGSGSGGGSVPQQSIDIPPPPQPALLPLPGPSQDKPDGDFAGESGSGIGKD